MNIEEALIVISLKQKKLLTYTDMADALNVSKQYITKLKEKKLTHEQIVLLENKFNVDLKYGITMGDTTEIEYYDLPKLNNLIKHPLITSLWIDSELVTKVWNKNPDNLKIITMPGDTMDGGEMPLRNGDILIIDTSITNPVIGGIYAYTTKNDSLLFVTALRQMADGSLYFQYKNTLYEPITKTLEETKKNDLKIIGRVLKDVSLELITN